MAAPTIDPYRKSDRYYHEETQHRFRASSFRLTNRITSLAPSAQTLIIHPFGAEETVAHPFAALTPEDRDDATHQGHMEAVFDVVYREWYPHRQSVLDVDQGAFFCSPVVSLCPGRPVGELVSFHRTLCARVAERVPGNKRTMMGGRWKGVRCLPFEVWPTFAVVFVVTSAGEWRDGKEGVRVVCKGEETARALGLAVERGTCILQCGDEGNGDESWLEFAMTLVDAMRAIVSHDEERRKPRDLDSEFYCEKFAGVSDR
ncbi:hypothetical protein MMC17_001309 [Xylographa soralifera]|nr:hypothetical protein [Xylographa soralifera]